MEKKGAQEKEGKKEVRDDKSRHRKEKMGRGGARERESRYASMSISSIFHPIPSRGDKTDNYQL